MTTHSCEKVLTTPKDGQIRLSQSRRQEIIDSRVLPLADGVGCTMPLSGLVVPILVVFVLILFIITLVVVGVDDVLLKLLLLDKTLLLLVCAADDGWPLASVALEVMLRIGGGSV